MESRYRFLTLGIPWSQSVPSRDVNAATRLSEASWRRDKVIYVTAHTRCAGGLKKKLNLRSGSQHHRHFAGFFNVHVQASTWGRHFYTVIPRNRPI